MTYSEARTSLSCIQGSSSGSGRLEWNEGKVVRNEDK